MAIKPLGHRVLVQPQKLEDVDKYIAAAKKAGIELPDQTKRMEQTKIDTGVVLKIGSTAYKHPDFGGTAWVEVGDHIAYARNAGKYVTDPETEQEYLILNDEDVVAVFYKDSE